ncbi:unnamed protein product [Cunninghamella blakesleeana]
MYSKTSTKIEAIKMLKWYESHKLISELHRMISTLVEMDQYINYQKPNFQAVSGLLFDTSKRFPSSGIFYCDYSFVLVEIQMLYNDYINVRNGSETMLHFSGREHWKEEENETRQHLLSHIQQLFDNMVRGEGDFFDQESFELYHSLKWNPDTLSYKSLYKREKARSSQN